ncbi:shikimate dehydrogenase [Schaedlerella arabinosiphila]|uniref:Shikimate dehydrogenase (NADP(+)) n=1 Tax=Schaedlerella arabinosiphila TaxID=2044587 RepID=A0A9X5H7I9_9FIRM|nr:shikimate dehydrogenase [Schaedlerella arabinosiphila]MCI9211600.1 shikimate dehydrogenase [Ruminococcus sp.]MCI9305627.1 shikimate dehydrogenase [Lachnospiraceae bacterium]KAI4443569.1 Shikimate dehydrogenase (NADP(+)) [Schaedlerella arabinosiphila]MCI9633365.1 shikimate dehydrogenase [Ruminococcus sp.]NDO69236.1 shikimate dehydrogenase [Schaedlerella arabinosiphila]
MKQITGHTGLTGLLGSPVAHSISPMMHNEAFEQLGLDYVYLAFDVGTDRLETAVEGLRALNVRGFNLTMPDKNLMCTLCDKLSPAAEISGAVNTVVNDGGVFTGYTTDGIGYMQAAKDAGHDLIGKKMTLMGAGGAATAILVQAALDGLSEISVFSIRDAFFPRAEKIVGQLNERTKCRVRLFDFDDESILRREIGESCILTNGTSVGMAPNTDRSVITDPSMFHQDLVVSDVIYNPKETLLLRTAREAGCRTFNGLYMLMYQGAEAFRLWTGQEMPIPLIKEKYFS